MLKLYQLSAYRRGKEAFYQYAAIDEYIRLRYLAAFEEQSTYSSMCFVQQLIKAFPFKIEKVQTDNGLEFTKISSKAKPENKTLIERQLEEYGIAHQKIRPYTPRRNGKVERSHKKDSEYFYKFEIFKCKEEYEEKLSDWNKEYNNFPMRPLE